MLGVFSRKVIWQLIKNTIVEYLTTRDDHCPVCQMDIWPDSKFSTGYGYPKSVFLREPDPVRIPGSTCLIRFFENAGSVGYEMNFGHL